MARSMGRRGLVGRVVAASALLSLARVVVAADSATEPADGWSGTDTTQTTLGSDLPSAGVWAIVLLCIGVLVNVAVPCMLRTPPVPQPSKRDWASRSIRLALICVCMGSLILKVLAFIADSWERAGSSAHHDAVRFGVLTLHFSKTGSMSLFQYCANESDSNENQIGATMCYLSFTASMLTVGYGVIVMALMLVACGFLLVGVDKRPRFLPLVVRIWRLLSYVAIVSASVLFFWGAFHTVFHSTEFSSRLGGSFFFWLGSCGLDVANAALARAAAKARLGMMPMQQPLLVGGESDAYRAMAPAPTTTTIVVDGSVPTAQPTTYQPRHSNAFLVVYPQQQSYAPPQEVVVINARQSIYATNV